MGRTEGGTDYFLNSFTGISNSPCIQKQSRTLPQVRGARQTIIYNERRAQKVNNLWLIKKNDLVITIQTINENKM